MSGIRSITRYKTIKGYASDGSAPIYVDSDDNRLKLIPAGSGTTEVILQEANGASSIENVITTRVLTSVDSGKTFFLGLAAGFTTTLPEISAAPGFHATFIVNVAPTGGDLVIAANAADLDKMVGGVHSSQATSADTETTLGADQFNFVANQAVIGDRFDIFTDGTNWYGRAFVALTAAGTFTG